MCPLPDHRHLPRLRAAERLLPALGLALLLGHAPAAAADERFGPFADVLEEGSLGRGFEGRSDGNGFVVDGERPDGWQYLVPENGTGEPGRRDVAVTLSLDEAGERAGAGIVYAFDRQSGAFLAFVLEPGNVVALYERTPLALELRHRGAMEGGDGAAPVLRVVEDDGQLTVTLDDQTAYAFEGWLVGSGEIGLLVKGAGTFRFHAIESSD